MNTEPLFTAADLISVYTRAQAIEDGVLIDVTAAASSYFKYPVALTAAAWAGFVAWSDEDTLRKGVPQSEADRLHTVIYNAMLEARNPNSRPDNLIVFKFRRVPRNGGPELKYAEEVEAKLHCGPGDTPAPVLTIMLPNED